MGRASRVASLWWVAGPAAGLLAGTALQMQQPELWVAGGVRGVGAAAVVLAVLAWFVHGRAPRLALAGATLAALALSFAMTSERAALRLADALPAALEGEDLEVTGLIAEMPRPGQLGTHFIFEVESARHGDKPVSVPQRLALGWYRGAADEALLLGPGEALRAGQRWRLPLRLRQPHGSANPHGFDLELWYFERGIGASGVVRSRAAQAAVKLDEAAGAPIERARQAAREAIERRVADPVAAGTLAALALGDQGAIDCAYRQSSLTLTLRTKRARHARSVDKRSYVKAVEPANRFDNQVLPWLSDCH